MNEKKNIQKIKLFAFATKQKIKPSIGNHANRTEMKCEIRFGFR